MKQILYTLLCLSIGNLAIAQNTVGLLSYVPSQTFDGYNLIYPHNQPNVYLIDNCGEIVHVWEDEPDFRPGNTVYLMENGNLIKTKRPAAVAGDPIWAGGGGAIVEIRSWDNDLLWSFELNNEDARLHHDIAPTDQGTILMLAWEHKTAEEAIQAGRDTALLIDGELWPDYVFEIDPETDEIVWEWHVWDHLIQDYDPSKDNYGVVEDHPERVDINYVFGDGVDDWMHSNALDFEPINDQLIISVPTFGEVWIVDKTTSTEEAAGSVGGFGNRGGDLMFRWGNPRVYRAGTEEDQRLFYQHDIQWIDDFLSSANPNFGKLAVFNNRVGENYSTANIIAPDYDMYNWEYPLEEGEAWGPAEFDKIFFHPDTTAIYSTGLSSIQILPNGNTLICSGRQGYSFELNPDGDIVWEYKTPLIMGQPASQGDTLELNNNLTFRIRRYPADYAAFEGKDLLSQGWIELNPDTTFCDQLVPAPDVAMRYDLDISPNPAKDMVVIEWQAGIYADVVIFDVYGKPVTQFRASGGRRYLDVSDWSAGTYFVQVDGAMSKKLVVY